MKWTLAAAGIALVAAGALHAVLEPLASWAEQERGAYLWRTEEWLALFTPANYADRGDGRLLLMGPSEAREAFVDSALRERLAGWETIQHAWVWSTLEELVVFLEYLERAHGDAALQALR